MVGDIFMVIIVTSFLGANLTSTIVNILHKRGKIDNPRKLDILTVIWAVIALASWILYIAQFSGI